ncbi:MAG: hypothetical protein AAF125_02380 [Chloroflexota bacterium]
MNATNIDDVSAVRRALHRRFGSHSAIIESTLVMNHRRNRTWPAIVEACRKVTLICMDEQAADDVEHIVCTTVGLECRHC